MVRIPAKSRSVGDVAPRAGRSDRLGDSRLGVGDGRQGQFPWIRQRDRIKVRTDCKWEISPRAMQVGTGTNWVGNGRSVWE